MKSLTDGELSALAEKAAAGDKEALEAILIGVRDTVFNLSLRMLGSFHDAEDASQDILLKIITHLSSFRGESAFSTWVFSIALNHLKNYKKHMFAKMPLSFEYYGEDILNGKTGDIPDLTCDAEKAVLAEELKMSCTNVMLQCMDADSRCIFILGTMFRVDSRIAGEILGITPENYRKKLSRIRKKMADFLSEYCGEYGKGACRCENRVNYAIQNHRISVGSRDYTSAKQVPVETTLRVKQAMENIDGISREFSFCKIYQAPDSLKKFIESFLNGASFSVVRDA